MSGDPLSSPNRKLAGSPQSADMNKTECLKELEEMDVKLAGLVVEKRKVLEAKMNVQEGPEQKSAQVRKAAEGCKNVDPAQAFFVVATGLASPVQPPLSFRKSSQAPGSTGNSLELASPAGSFPKSSQTPGGLVKREELVAGLASHSAFLLKAPQTPGSLVNLEELVPGLGSPAESLCQSSQTPGSLVNREELVVGFGSPAESFCQSSQAPGNLVKSGELVARSEHMQQRSDAVGSNMHSPATRNSVNSPRGPQDVNMGSEGTTESCNANARNLGRPTVVNFRYPGKVAIRLYDAVAKSSRVVFGPGKILLGCNEGFTKVPISSSNANPIQSSCLPLGPAKMTTTVNVHSSDEVKFLIELSFKWHFDAEESSSDAQNIFENPDFVRDTCKTMTTRIQDAVSVLTAAQFHEKAALVVSRAVLGVGSQCKFPTMVVVCEFEVKSVRRAGDGPEEEGENGSAASLASTLDSPAACARQLRKLQSIAKGLLPHFERASVNSGAESTKADVLEDGNRRPCRLRTGSQTERRVSQGKGAAESVGEAQGVGFDQVWALRAKVIEREGQIEQLNKKLAEITLDLRSREIENAELIGMLDPQYLDSEGVTTVRRLQQAIRRLRESVARKDAELSTMEDKVRQTSKLLMTMREETKLTLKAKDLVIEDLRGMLDELKDRPLVRDSKRDSGGRSVRGSNSPLNTRANSSRSLAKRSHSSWAIGQDVDHQTVTNNVLAKLDRIAGSHSSVPSTNWGMPSNLACDRIKRQTSSERRNSSQSSASSKGGLSPMRNQMSTLARYREIASNLPPQRLLIPSNAPAEAGFNGLVAQSPIAQAVRAARTASTGVVEGRSRSNGFGVLGWLRSISVRSVPPPRACASLETEYPAQRAPAESYD